MANRVIVGDNIYKFLENKYNYFDAPIVIVNNNDNYYNGFSLYLGREGIVVYINHDLVNGHPQRILEYMSVDIL